MKPLTRNPSGLKFKNCHQKCRVFAEVTSTDKVIQSRIMFNAADNKQVTPLKNFNKFLPN